MDIFFATCLLFILAETSFLCAKNLRKEKRNSGRRKVFVDSSALMDGRILEVAKTGFLADNFYIPRSVTREMQILADGKDGEKRTRARAGLENANEMERIVFFSAEIYDDSRLGKMPVDERLLILAKEEGGVILTCDYNLTKVAATENIETLNINDLAVVLNQKMQAGDKFKIKILEKGANPRQGVGHLSDGTMVVVEGGEKQIGKEIEVEFARYLQTGTGRMIFATIPRTTTPHTASPHKKRNYKK